ncbi:MAG: hypothetical protein AAFO84_00090 [Cyanobacteria bacterium J06598_1]
MDRRQQYGLWGAIAGIFLLAIFGVRSAANWLNGSTEDTRTDTIVSVEGNRGNGTRDSVVSQENSTRTNARFGDQSETQGSETLTFSPLEEAGTYIQRQKRVERDAIVADTRVDAVPIANNNTPTAATPDTRVTQPAPSSTTQTAQPSPTAPAAKAVPALW